MEKDLVDILSKLLDQKLEPINNKLINLENSQNQIREDIKEIKKVITENNIELVATLKDISERFDRVEYKINRTDDDVISIKNNLKVIK